MYVFNSIYILNFIHIEYLHIYPHFILIKGILNLSIKIKLDVKVYLSEIKYKLDCCMYELAYLSHLTA